MINKKVNFSLVSLIVVIVAFLILNYINYQKIVQSDNEIVLLNSLMQQKDMIIKKLMERVEIKQKELDNSRTELVDTKRVVNTIKAEINTLKGQKP